MLHAARIRKLYLYRAGISKAEIARRLKLPRTSVRRVPCHGFFPEVGRPTPYARLPKAHVLSGLLRVGRTHRHAGAAHDVITNDPTQLVYNGHK